MAPLTWHPADFEGPDADEHAPAQILMTHPVHPEVTVKLRWLAVFSQAQYEAAIVDVIAALQAAGYTLSGVFRYGTGSQTITYAPE